MDKISDRIWTKLYPFLRFNMKVNGIYLGHQEYKELIDSRHFHGEHKRIYNTNVFQVDTESHLEISVENEE